MPQDVRESEDLCGAPSADSGLCSGKQAPSSLGLSFSVKMNSVMSEVPLGLTFGASPKDRPASRGSWYPRAAVEFWDGSAVRRGDSRLLQPMEQSGTYGYAFTRDRDPKGDRAITLARAWKGMVVFTAEGVALNN